MITDWTRLWRVMRLGRDLIVQFMVLRAALNVLGRIAWRLARG